ncbi:ABC transporter permease [Microterricola viridarii]|uniref:ABC-type transport system, involved in lipoprotein release, permease component n=1 Tax=Microterricola viridarii TaxID=412690 RepID=A0A1H1ZIS8_9MICO|nr:ABC transporter permease [Microterricola viridarii]SDT33467.1 ABC-type transport system, involved in lipoprotein release, permease component [Microterricola viridarii]
MFFTLLRRELAGRRKQTVIIAVGMGLAIALVIVVNAFSAGVKDAQASVLSSIYGVGTDVTVTQSPTPPSAGDASGGPGRFDFGAGAGATSDGTTAISTSRLEASRGTSTFDAATLTTVAGIDNVAAASGTLALNNTTFSGELPDMSQMQQGAAPGDGVTPPQGGPDGAGGSSFDVDSFSVLGLDPSAAAVGPLSSVTLSDGRTLTAADSDASVAVLDADYATTAGLAVGDTIAVGDSSLEVVGIVSSNSADAATAANVYIPLAVAQQLSGLDGQLSTVYVQAASSNDIAQVQSELEAALPDATVSTQAELASSVSGSLATASSLVTSLGLWLSVAVLLAAFLLAILFTISGVNRRTREFGTLKAIGWSNRRIVGQVAGESTVQGLIGGAVGVVVGLIGVLVINLVSPTLSGGVGGTGGGNSQLAAGPGGAGGPGGMPGGFGQAASAAASTDITLQAPVALGVVLVAVGLAVLGGLIAGAFGGWRAARLRPAEALRSIG